jgi:hypothetical protein
MIVHTIASMVIKIQWRRAVLMQMNVSLMLIDAAGSGHIHQAYLA